ncbi:MAG: hypothetical protein J6035_01390 [Bacteroidaceae bacterium]|nr:hypothetical protein [Bacteroidaceae bacterium]
MKKKTYIVPACTVYDVSPADMLLNPGSSPYPDPDPDLYYDEDEVTGDSF